MIEQQIEIINKLGLHARAAAKLVNTAATFASQVTIQLGDQHADAKSIMSVMMLAAEKGSVITIQCSGADEQQALTTLCGLINDFFGEEE
ncbi:MAG: HPr family phosphocarrier protein [Acidiferrobacterales bacterium]|nr:HPr family phosphocarrier protein [Acidiferrobacterales bacterium]